ncbi:MAG: LarC family nickel insertion protein [Alphaproteobacteria bacterium]|nr:LarC family nickel insertion protein [Alphaproteobacteria bacterium]
MMTESTDTVAPVTAIHLDAVGGLAGDMFAAALLDARPDLWPACQAAIGALELPMGVEAAVVPHNDEVFRGARFQVSEPAAGKQPGHDHVHWSEIRGLLRAALKGGVLAAALDIFELLAEAEAAVHGIPVEGVAFHEVGAVDSIVDIVTAAALITALGPCRWSVGSIPRGRGLVKSQHGMLPLPAPAVLQLLQGFSLFDDGEDGERVTPTGAAILRYLAPAQGPDTVPRRLLSSGVGFGTRRFRARSNILRATCYGAAETPALADQVEVLRCEIDDQTGEDLAVAIERLRQTAGVLDVCQWPVFGKKGRMAVALQVLAEPDAAERVLDEILDETTTLGVRRGLSQRRIIARELVLVDDITVKRAGRPSGVSVKAEMEDLAPNRGAARRQDLRRAVEAKAMSERGEDD